jgi:hypothetical protein
MTELIERSREGRESIDQWFEGNYLEHAVIAASQYETSPNEVFRASHVINEVLQNTYEANFKSLAKLQALPRVSWAKLDREILDTLAEAIKTHADVVATQLGITSEQLYSMTFADFISAYESEKKLQENPGKKSLAQRLAEAYDEEAEQEDEKFFRSTKAYYNRKLNNED